MVDARQKYGDGAPERPKAAKFAQSRSLLLVIAGGLFTIAFALFLLSITTAHEGIIFGPDEATALLAVDMIAASLLLALASSGNRIRLTLQMILIYMTIYLILPGYYHSSQNHYPFFNLQYDHDIRLSGAVMIALFLSALMVGYLLAEQTGVSGERRKTIGREILFPSLPLLVTLTGLSYLAAIVYLFQVGPAAAFSTRAEFGAAGGSILEVGLFVTLPRNITFISFAYCYVLFMRSRKVGLSFYYLLANLIPFFTANYPFVLARFATFGIILFFLIQTINMKRPATRNMLTGAFIFGALFAMPYLDSLTRRLNATTATTVQGAYEGYIQSLDFDGLQSIQNAVIFTERSGYQYGNQIISAALFYVPRTVWTGKGETTGEQTSKAAGYTFHNISQPLPSEFFVDFGWLGVIVMSGLLGYWIARLDIWIDRNWENGPRARLIAGIVVAYAIIVMRGSLLGVISAVSVFTVGVFIIIKLGLIRPESIKIRRKPKLTDGASVSPRVERHARAVAANKFRRSGL